MEKSIEAIWKKGFLEPEALVVPKLNNLYDQKSKHLIDKFTRMFKINLNAIFIGSIVVLVISFLVGIPVMGILLVIISNTIVIVNRKLQKGLLEINVNANSYQYIKTFDGWLKDQLAINSKMARIYYPLIFLSVVLGFWFSPNIPNIFESPNQIYFFYGIPVFWALGVLFITALLSLFGGVIYKWDVNLVYGNVFRKLNDMIADMDELRA